MVPKVLVIQCVCGKLIHKAHILYTANGLAMIAVCKSCYRRVYGTIHYETLMEQVDADGNTTALIGSETDVGDA